MSQKVVINPATGNLDVVSEEDLTGYVSYTGATANLDLGDYELTANKITIGSQAAGVDYELVFNGETYQATVTWMEDERILKIGNGSITQSLQLNGSSFGTVYFKDTTTTDYIAMGGSATWRSSNHFDFQTGYPNLTSASNRIKFEQMDIKNFAYFGYDSADMSFLGGKGGNTNDATSYADAGDGSSLIFTAGAGGVANSTYDAGDGGDITFTAGLGATALGSGADGADGKITFTTGGALAMTIDASGNVGIGTTSPNMKLVLGEDNAKLGFGAAEDASICYDGTDSVWHLREAGNGRLYITADGTTPPVYGSDGLLSVIGNSTAQTGLAFTNLGTGTSSDCRFSVFDSSQHYLAFSQPAVTNTQAGFFGFATRADADFIFNIGGTSRGLGIGTLESTDFSLGSASTARITMTGAGKVGINTTDPAATKVEISDGNDIGTAWASIYNDFAFTGADIHLALVDNDGGSQGCALEFKDVDSATPFAFNDQWCFTRNTSASTSAFYLRYGTNVTSFSNPAVIEFESDKTVNFASDNQKTKWGAGKDASIYYDGTDMIINPKEVGSGNLIINSDISADNLSGTNTGDQTDISDFTGTKAEFNTACTDGDFAFSGGAFHDGFSDFVANEHIDWTTSQAPTVIHADNYTNTVSSYGADNQIPYTNGTTDDFDYSANLTFDGSALTIGSPVTINDDGSNGICQTIDNDGTNHGLYIKQDGVLASQNRALWVYSDTAQTSSDLVRIENDNASSSVWHTLYVKNDGTGHGVGITQNGVNAIGDHGFSVYSNAALTNANSALAYLRMDNASSTEPVLEIVNDGSGAAIEVSDGDIRNVARTDYFSSSTIVGWAATPTGDIYYKKVGNLVFVEAQITGTSNADSITFTLPYTCISGRHLWYAGGYSVDDGTVSTTAFGFRLAGGSSTVTCFKDMALTAWTASGTKTIMLSFFYEANT